MTSEMTRETAIANLKADIKYWFEAYEASTDLHTFVAMMMPSVTPAEKIGQWIFNDTAKEHAHCSECGYGNVDLVNGKPHNYCENCGAKMKMTEG